MAAPASEPLSLFVNLAGQWLNNAHAVMARHQPGSMVTNAHAADMDKLKADHEDLKLMASALTADVAAAQAAKQEAADKVAADQAAKETAAAERQAAKDANDASNQAAAERQAAARAATAKAAAAEKESEQRPNRVQGAAGQTPSSPSSTAA